MWYCSGECVQILSHLTRAVKGLLLVEIIQPLLQLYAMTQYHKDGSLPSYLTVYLYVSQGCKVTDTDSNSCRSTHIIFQDSICTVFISILQTCTHPHVCVVDDMNQKHSSDVFEVILFLLLEISAATVLHNALSCGFHIHYTLKYPRGQTDKRVQCVSAQPSYRNHARYDAMLC